MTKAFWAGVFIACVIVMCKFYAGGSVSHAGVRAREQARKTHTSTGTPRQMPAEGGAVSTLFVVRTGVHDVQEFKAHPDAIARQFYRKLGIHEVSELGAPVGGFVYVSYRRGDRCCFWTDRQRMIPLGEMLMTNTDFWVRKRCGNALSAAKMSPVEARDRQPSDEELGTEGVEPREWDYPKPDLEIPNLIEADYAVPVGH